MIFLSLFEVVKPDQGRIIRADKKVRTIEVKSEKFRLQQVVRGRLYRKFVEKELLRDDFLNTMYTTTKSNTTKDRRMEMRTHFHADRDANAYALNVTNVHLETSKSAQPVSIPLVCKANQKKAS